MIKVVYTYKTKKENLNELMEKFMQSGDKKFSTDVNNIKIEMFKQEKDDFMFIILDIYYNNLEEYNIRKEFEMSNTEWQEIWFADNIKHTEVSVELMELMQ